MTKEELVEIVNQKLAMYYTNPLINMSNDEVKEITWNFTDAQRLPYGRGFAYAIAIDALIRENSDGQHGLESISLGLISRSLSGRPYGIEEYMSLLSTEIGGEAAHNAYKEMRSGKLVIPKRAHILGDDTVLELVRKDSEVFEVGFDDRKALYGEHIIEGLVLGSKAEAAGLRNGDQLLSRFKLDDYKGDPDKILTLVVGHEIDGDCQVHNQLPATGIGNDGMLSAPAAFW